MNPIEITRAARVAGELAAEAQGQKGYSSAYFEREFRLRLAAGEGAEAAPAPAPLDPATQAMVDRSVAAVMQPPTAPAPAPVSPEIAAIRAEAVEAVQADDLARQIAARAPSGRRAKPRSI
jgi:hypothetical protein